MKYRFEQKKAMKQCPAKTKMLIPAKTNKGLEQTTTKACLHLRFRSLKNSLKKTKKQLERTLTSS